MEWRCDYVFAGTFMTRCSEPAVALVSFNPLPDRTEELPLCQWHLKGAEEAKIVNQVTALA
jgi:hypothetical protein